MFLSSFLFFICHVYCIFESFLKNFYNVYTPRRQVYLVANDWDVSRLAWYSAIITSHSAMTHRMRARRSYPTLGKMDPSCNATVLCRSPSPDYDSSCSHPVCFRRHTWRSAWSHVRAETATPRAGKYSLAVLEICGGLYYQSHKESDSFLFQPFWGPMGKMKNRLFCWNPELRFLRKFPWSSPRRDLPNGMTADPTAHWGRS